MFFFQPAWNAFYMDKGSLKSFSYFFHSAIKMKEKNDFRQMKNLIKETFILSHLGNNYLAQIALIRLLFYGIRVGNLEGIKTRLYQIRGHNDSDIYNNSKPFSEICPE